jgi:hypothetical protein
LLFAAVVLAPAMMAGYLIVSVFFMPQWLLFPHHRIVEGVSVYSDAPIPDEAAGVAERSGALLQASALFKRGEAFGPIFLTDGGWRWRLLSVGAGGSFALTRPSTESIVVNRSDFRSDKVWNGSSIAGERSLSGVIAHERTHTLIRRRFGALADRAYPTWVREGYCDFVAGSSTLSDRQAAEARAANPRLPALIYYDARQRVTAVLASNGGSVQALFEGSIARR